MAGSKKNKIKKFVSPSHNSTPDQAQTEDDNALVDDLLAELDSRNQTVQQESATVLLEMQQHQENTVGDNARSVKKKQDSKSRHEARQVNIPSIPFVDHTLTCSRREKQQPWLRVMHPLTRRQMQS
jgi:recombination DNA repair RAD52 pathway protein